MTELAGSAVKLWRWSPVLVVVLALAAAGWAAGGGTGLSGGRLPPREQDQPPPSAAVTTAPPAEAATPPTGAVPGTPDTGWLYWLVAGLFLGLIVAVVAVFLYVGVRYLLTERVQRREIVDQPASQPPDPAEAERVREAVRAGLADLDAGGDARRAVIACWLRLERIAAEAGAARLAADTPGDLVARLLAGHRVREDALVRLADAYRRARYAPAEVDADLLATARQALHDIALQLGALVPEPRP